MLGLGATVGIAIVAVGVFAAFCLVYYFAWFRPREEKHKQHEERRASNQTDEHQLEDGEDVIELEAVVIHRHRDRDPDPERILQQSGQDEPLHQSPSQQTSPTRIADQEDRPNAPEYNPLRMHPSMHGTHLALPGPPLLPPVFYVPQPPSQFLGPVLPYPPPPPPCPDQTASGPPEPPPRRHRGRRHRRHSQSTRVRHPFPGHATTISDDNSDRGGSLSPNGRRSRSASRRRSPGDTPTQDSMVGGYSVASSSLDAESKSRLNDLVQNGGDPVSPVEQNPDNDYGATRHRQSALEALESAPDLGLLSPEDGPIDPAARQRVGRAHRCYEINQDQHTNGFMLMRSAGDEPRTDEPRVGHQYYQESQTATSTDSSSVSADESQKVEPVSPIDTNRFPADDALGLGFGEPRVGRLSQPAVQGPREGPPQLGRPGPQNQPPPQPPWFGGPAPGPQQQPIPESRIGGRQGSPSRDFRERPAARTDFGGGFPGTTDESRMGPNSPSSSSGPSYRQGDNEPRGPPSRRGRIQDSPTFGDLVSLQQSRAPSVSGHRRSASILHTGFFNNNLPGPNQDQGRSSVASQASSTGAVCSYDSDSDHAPQRPRRPTSVGGGSIFTVRSTSNNNNAGGGRGGNRSVSGPGGFPNGGGGAGD